MRAQWLRQSAAFAAVNGLIIDLAGNYRTVTSPGGLRGVSGTELWYLGAQLLATALYVPSELPIIHFLLRLLYVSTLRPSDCANPLLLHDNSEFTNFHAQLILTK